MSENISIVVLAADFAAQKHRGQRRKGAADIPYINHPLKVAKYLCEIGEINDPEVLAAAVLHDTIEDTDTEFDDLVERFGQRTAEIVLEVSDDNNLSKAERKQAQIDHASRLSYEAKLVKLADKIANVEDMIANPPGNWSKSRRCDYVEWGRNVVKGLSGTNQALEKRFRDVADTADCELEQLSQD